MILEFHRQGLSVSAIAERTGHDRKTARKYIREGLAAPKYKPRHPRPTLIEPFEAYLRERVAAWLSRGTQFSPVWELNFLQRATSITDYQHSSGVIWF